MRAVVQRIEDAKVYTEGTLDGKIGKGLLVYIGFCPEDGKKDIDYMVSKITGLRIFEDEAGKMNLSVKDVDGEILIVSQFTLYGDCRKGRRPSFIRAGSPKEAQETYEEFLDAIRKEVSKVSTGTFQAEMQVVSTNDGPVTLLLDSEKGF